MKTRVLLSFLAIVVSVATTTGQNYTLAPVKPTIGHVVKVKYDTRGGNAPLKGKSGLVLEVLQMRTKDLPLLETVPLKQSGSSWIGDFELKDDQARLLVFRVVAGEDQDNNDGNCLDFLVYGKDGKPLEGAYFQRGSFHLSGFLDFKHQRDVSSARKAFAEERKLYPNNWRVYPAEWSIIMREDRENGPATVKTELETYTERFGGNEEAMAAVLMILDQVGLKEQGEEIKRKAIEKNPTGPISETVRLNTVYQERDPMKRGTLAEKMLADFPSLSPGPKDNLLSILASSYIQAKQPEKALEFLDNMAKPNPTFYNSIAWGWIEKGENLDQAVALAKRGIDLSANPTPESKPSYMSLKQYMEQMSYSHAMVLDTYAFGLFKQGKYDEAEKSFARAHELSKGVEPEITERLAMAYNQNGKFADAVAVCTRAVQTGKTTDGLFEQFKTAYVKVNGSDKGYDEAIAKARQVEAKELKAKVVKERINKPAIPFALKAMDGTSVNLGDLKGKVVVIDFWATWCGPCISSFPTLQKVYDKYKSNPDVVILTLNTWERVGGNEREDIVKKFIEKNKYTFPVLYDEGFVDKYGVEGIPTKFVIDRKGKIAFKTIGFSGADEMMEEMTLQLDMLLAEK